MRTVENEIFVHLNTTADYQVSKTYEFGKMTNPFFRYYDEFEPLVTKPRDELLMEYMLYVRECLFEDVRQSKYPSCPSRMSCIWLLPDDKQSLDYWARVIPRHVNVVKFKCSGVIHEADERYLALQTFNIPLQKRLADLYWSGESITKGLAHKEFLFAGSATVLGLYPPHQVPILEAPENQLADQTQVQQHD